MCHFILRLLLGKVSRHRVSAFSGLNAERTTVVVSHRATAVGGAEVVYVEQVKARLCLEMVFQRRWGVKSTKGETGGGTLLDFSRLGVPQGRVSRLFDLITSEGHC